MNAIEFQLTLVEPVLIANPVTGDENSATGMSYIPGSVIRGALAQRFKGGKSVAIEGMFQQMFFDKARFLNAYPLVNGKRTLPTPLSWRREFANGLATDSITDLACLAESAWANDNLKRLGDGEAFCSLQAPPVRLDEDDDERDDPPPLPTTELCAAEQGVDVHIFQNDRRTIKEGGSGIFRYEAIAAGEAFAGTVISEDATVLDEVTTWLKVGAEFKIGKSRSAGHGLVEVTHVQTIADWREFEPLPEVSGVLVVTLLSDALVRDATGSESTSIQSVVGGRPEPVFAKAHLVGGFNQTWGLPLPQSLAISAGSVFVFKDEPALRQKLVQAEREGIGERRIEGFGRIAVNWHGAEKIKVVDTDADYGKAPPVTTSRDEAERMIERMWRVTLEDALARASVLKDSPKLNSAQLSRVRVLAREALRRDEPTYVTDQLGQMRKTARVQFERARVNDMQMLAWIKDVAGHPEQVENKLRLNGANPPSIGDVTLPDDRRNRLRREFAMRLIDGVLRHAAKGTSDE